MRIAWQIEPVHGKVYVLNLETKKFYHFEGVSKKIWVLISEGVEFNTIVNRLSKKYDIDMNTIYDDTVSFCKSLFLEGLVMKNEKF